MVEESKQPPSNFHSADQTPRSTIEHLISVCNECHAYNDRGPPRRRRIRSLSRPTTSTSSWWHLLPLRTVWKSRRYQRWCPWAGVSFFHSALLHIFYPPIIERFHRYEMARALCEAGLAGIAILDILPEFGESAIKELHADFGL